MTKEIEAQFKQIVSQLSDRERSKNQALAKQTARVLVAIEYLKAVVKEKKGA